jgi:inosose dehydratase
MTDVLERVAGAPITWGVCEAPGWGFQLSPDRVLQEMAEIGLRATELGPDDFLPDEPRQLLALLASHGLRAAAGFVPIVLHRREVVDEQLDYARRSAARLARCEADVMVVAAATGGNGYEASDELDDPGWRMLTETLEQVTEVAAEHDLSVALHPHQGTVIEGPSSVYRLLESSPVPLCIDTGHLSIGGADPLEVTTAASGRVAHVHLKDIDRDLADGVRTGRLGYSEAARRGLYRPLGSGDVDIAGIVTRLESTIYRGWYVLEQDAVLEGSPAPGSGPIVDAAQSLDWLRRVVRKQANVSAQGSGR